MYSRTEYVVAVGDDVGDDVVSLLSTKGSPEVGADVASLSWIGLASVCKSNSTTRNWFSSVYTTNTLKHKIGKQ